jgi:hypothetical protein
VLLPPHCLHLIPTASLFAPYSSTKGIFLSTRLDLRSHACGWLVVLGAALYAYEDLTVDSTSFVGYGWVPPYPDGIPDGIPDGMHSDLTPYTIR